VDGVLDFLEHFVEFEFEVVYVVLRLCRSSESFNVCWKERMCVSMFAYPLRVFRDDVVQEQVRPVE
jgi:hypothetical protein